jgi:predicted nucleic acid-binding protein
LAIQRSRKAKVSFWDALILEAALAADATFLYSEDFQDGSVFGRLRIVNPFKLGIGPKDRSNVRQTSPCN